MRLKSRLLFSTFLSLLAKKFFPLFRRMRRKKKEGKRGAATTPEGRERKSSTNTTSTQTTTLTTNNNFRALKNIANETMTARIEEPFEKKRFDHISCINY